MNENTTRTSITTKTSKIKILPFRINDRERGRVLLYFFNFRKRKN